MSSNKNHYRIFGMMDVLHNLCHGHNGTTFPYAGQERYHCNGGEVTFSCYSMFLCNERKKHQYQVLIPGFHANFPGDYDIPKCMELEFSFHDPGVTSQITATHYRESDVLPMFFDSRKRVYREEEVSQRIADCERAITRTQTDLWEVNSITTQAAALLRPIMADILSRVTTVPVQCVMIIGRYRDSGSPISVLQVQIGDSYCDARISINDKGEAYMVAKYSNIHRYPFDKNGRWNAFSIIKCGIIDAEDVVRKLMPFVVMVADDNREES